MEINTLKIFKEKYSGKYLLEIAQAGNGNNLNYIVCEQTYEDLLWEKDNKLNKEGEEFIGSFRMEKL